MREEKQQFLEQGADRYLAKPFEREDLLATIAQLAGN
jgi:DNA-binding response OmpR family regulator